MNADDAGDPFRRGDDAAPGLVRTSKLAGLAESSLELGLTFGMLALIAWVYALTLFAIPLTLLTAVAFALPAIARVRIARRPELADTPALDESLAESKVVAARVAGLGLICCVVISVARCS